MRNLLALFIIAIVFSSFSARTEWNPSPTEIPEFPTPIALHSILSEDQAFDRPVWMAPVPGQPDRLLVLEHMSGQIWEIRRGNDSEKGFSKKLFLDLGIEVSDGPWEGLMCLAFHPDFTTNKKYYLKHEAVIDGKRHTTIVERFFDDKLESDSGTPSRRLIAIPQPADNHNGGTLAFGPDGYLYFAMGDGGPQKDPNGYTQNLSSLLGKMLRIDVNTRAPGKQYGIPCDNPFVHLSNAAPEVFALGLREPWRFSFDTATGAIWVGDVGQNDFEEITIVGRGENHGWNVWEGFEKFSEQYHRELNVYTDPILALNHRQSVSVTGGYVYRGKRSPGWHGVYLFGDFGTRRLWGMKWDKQNSSAGQLYRIRDSPQSIASFAQDDAGEIYVIGYEGMIYRMDLSKTDWPTEGE